MTPSSYTHESKDLRAFKVFAIEEGTVIDHIPAHQALSIIRILDLDSKDTIVTMGLNLPSKRLGKKDIIKVEYRFLSPAEANRVALFAPTASINIIKAYQVAEKFQISLPETITGILACPNPNCITTHEHMNTIFYVFRSGETITFGCRYCEKRFSQADIIPYIKTT